jgi:hypothetical protein
MEFWLGKNNTQAASQPTKKEKIKNKKVKLEAAK